MRIEVPLVRTARLVLRGHEITDFEDCVAMRADPLVTRYIGGVLDHEEVWSRLLRSRGHWSLMGYGFWVVVEESTGRFVGEVGFQDFRRNLQPALGEGPEMGWVLATWAQGRGYATEACRAALSWLQAHMKHERITCMIHADNRRSVQVARKCAFQPWNQATYKDAPMILFERFAAPAD